MLPMQRLKKKTGEIAKSAEGMVSLAFLASFFVNCSAWDNARSVGHHVAVEISGCNRSPADNPALSLIKTDPLKQHKVPILFTSGDITQV